MQYEILRGDCISQMRAMSDNSFDSIVCDPPYELGFMGKSWDASGIAYSVEMWAEALRVLKPGGHLLAFSGSRTYHRMTCAIEDAGFEVRDQIMWVYGSGFPKSLDVSKAIDKRGGNAGLTAEIGAAIKAARLSRKMSATECDRLFCDGSTNWSWFEGRAAGQRAPTPATFALIVTAWPELASYAEAVAEADREVTGQDTKARSTSGNSALPTVGGETVYKSWDITAPATDAARQWEGWGTALKPAHEPICVARKPLAKGATVAANVLQFGTAALNIDGCRVGTEGSRTNSSGANVLRVGVSSGMTKGTETVVRDCGRWPANLIHSGEPEVLALFPDAKGQQGAVTGDEPSSKTNNVYGQFDGRPATTPRVESETSAARFFYCAKASKSDRGPNNTHPTVKPLALMQYLCRLVTPPGGRILDPFAGSGSTIVAALREGFIATGIELIDDHADIIEGRVDHELYGDLL